MFEDFTPVCVGYCCVDGDRWCRGCGAQVVPVKRYEGVVMDHGLGITQACMAMTSFSDAPAPNSGLSAVGEIRLMPDISTRRRLPWYYSLPCIRSGLILMICNITQLSRVVEDGMVSPN